MLARVDKGHQEFPLDADHVKAVDLSCRAKCAHILMTGQAVYLEEEGLHLILKKVEADLICQKSIILQASGTLGDPLFCTAQHIVLRC